MRDFFYLPDTQNKYKRWDILLSQYIFPLYYMKLHIQRIKKGSKADQYVAHNLTWSGV